MLVVKGEMPDEKIRAPQQLQLIRGSLLVLMLVRSSTRAGG
jgi:hypothetical protein